MDPKLQQEIFEYYDIHPEKYHYYLYRNYYLCSSENNENNSDTLEVKWTLGNYKGQTKIIISHETHRKIYKLSELERDNKGNILWPVREKIINNKTVLIYANIILKKDLLKRIVGYNLYAKLRDIYENESEEELYDCNDITYKPKTKEKNDRFNYKKDKKKMKRMKKHKLNLIKSKNKLLTKNKDLIKKGNPRLTLTYKNKQRDQQLKRQRNNDFKYARKIWYKQTETARNDNEHINAISIMIEENRANLGIILSDEDDEKSSQIRDNEQNLDDWLVD